MPAVNKAIIETNSRDLFPGALELMILESLRREPAQGYAPLLTRCGCDTTHSAWFPSTPEIARWEDTPCETRSPPTVFRGP